MNIIRVIAKHTPALYGLLGLVNDEECTPTIMIGDETYYRARSTPRWVLYKRAVQDERPGWTNLHPEQR